MSPAREAFALPVLFLTTTLVGGLRVAAGVRLVPPPLGTLLLALILLGALVRAGALAPDRLMSARRGALANLNGLVVLTTAFFGSAQAFALVTPESGLPRVAFGVFLFVLLLNTHAASPDRVRLLRSVMVILGSAFTLKFIVLAALSDPAQGRLARMLQIFLEGVTLGAITQEPLAPATGYVALFTLIVYLTALSLLPGVEPTSAALTRSRSMPDA